jgi:hypothetical protein
MKYTHYIEVNSAFGVELMWAVCASVYPEVSEGNNLRGEINTDYAFKLDLLLLLLSSLLLL